MNSRIVQHERAEGRFSSDEFRAACALFPSGVTVITRLVDGGKPYGMTASSFTSVSLEPPLILVCVDRMAGFLRALKNGDGFMVNVLSEQQQGLSVRFASTRESERFSDLEWHNGWGNLPVLPEVVANFACEVDQLIEAGDHFVLIGAVRALATYPGRPLVWCDRNYHCLPGLG